MSKVLINKYYSSIDRAHQHGKSKNETAVRNYFWMLLNEYAQDKNYEVIPEVAALGTHGVKVYPDGIVKTHWGIDVGYWESKDEKDVIDDEIAAKIKKGYPLTNTLFEDTNTAVLFQRGAEVMRVPVRDADKLDTILKQFIDFKSETVYIFEEAIENFKEDIPKIIEVLRFKIKEIGEKNKNYISARNSFLELCKAEINPEITLEDIREMMIQHLLTSDIFNKIFDDADFHKHNTIAVELEKLISILFTYSERRNLLESISHYYDTINAAAAGIADHHEKQKFLKVLYENFYKVYNPKAADRLGVIYTPNEIVKFMIESTDYLLHKHFGKTLADKNVDILDPATGTGTFITDIIEHIPNKDLIYKYKNELHANEVAILPYYIASLNIEFTYKQKIGQYAEFESICFVDTLDNTISMYYGTQTGMFGLSSENANRIKKQNDKKISVIIGNPPYNANQKNENENNKNREYPNIDKRIKETFIAKSTAQKTKVYDMYARFYRWAMDRLDKNGIIALITNRSFIDSRTFDGFRKCIQDEFNHAYIIDTKSDVRANPKIAGTTHNVFGIQTGVAIMLLVKKENNDEKCKIEYVAMEDNWRKEEKLDWLKTHKLNEIDFQTISPDKNNNWINLSEDNDWDKLIPTVDKDVKAGKKEGSIFELFSLGIATNRDEWVFDLNKKNLQNKVKFFCEVYEKEKVRWQKSNKNIPLNDFVDRTIKWTEELEHHIERKSNLVYFNEGIRTSSYRPFIRKFLYLDKIIIHRLYQNENFFGSGNKVFNNKTICFVGLNSIKQFSVLSTDGVPELAGLSGGSNLTHLPYYRYDKEGNQIENISSWGLQQFQTHYKDKKITKEDIFNYIYGVLHNPAYRTKYELNLKREFPRIPFYEDFKKWSNWGKKLMELHIDYETVKPFNLKVTEVKAVKKSKGEELFEEVKEPEALYKYTPKVKVKLKADKEKGIIELDEVTSLSGIPKEAWEYKLGNRSALEWILDQYKEKKPSDPTIAEKFNTYRFADYKEQVIDLLKRVCTVSVETMKIVEEMKGEGN
jgi:predicted helicase